MEIKDRTPYEKFEVAIRKAINQNSLENESNTPDYVAAVFLRKIFELYNKAVNQRDRCCSIDSKEKDVQQPVQGLKEELEYALAEGKRLSEVADHWYKEENKKSYQLIEKEEQLAEARQIIEELIKQFKSEANGWNQMSAIERAEQFLKS